MRMVLHVRLHSAAVICGLSLPMLCGCTLSPLAKQTAAFSHATNMVTRNANGAFQTAVQLHRDEETSSLYQKYAAGQSFNPNSLTPLIDAHGLEVRSQVLNGIKTYAQTLADLTSGTKSPKLDAAAASVGSNLKTLSTDMDTAAGDTKGSLSLSTQQSNEAQTALRTLGNFLAASKVKSSVPKIIREMDPTIATLCDVLESDITVLRRQSADDADQMLVQQDQFIRESKLTPIERRQQVQDLILILNRKAATERLLTGIQSSLKKLAQAHHALAASAGKKSSPALLERIADVAASAQQLADYYESLPAK